jgi:GH15 family glucan-1,4-alpha-glucosidase
MPSRIEDYALIGNCESAAMVGRNGSIDGWLFPGLIRRHGFAALLGGPENGRWLIAPTAESRITRHYRQGTLVLETRFETADGVVTLIDGMGRRDGCADLVRVIRGECGRVAVRMELVIRCEYGSIIPWVRRLHDGRVTAVAGPDRLTLSMPAAVHGENLRTIAEFDIGAGEEIPFSLTSSPSYRSVPAAANAQDTIEEATTGWLGWARPRKAEGSGEWSEAVLRSLITLKGLTHVETGGIVAAATTSLPEQLGGPRNWDYRFCWLRDATLTLYAFLNSGFFEEAAAWRDWLLRAIAGAPPQMQIMYGIAGERRLLEYEVPWLKGYEVRILVKHIGTTFWVFA